MRSGQNVGDWSLQVPGSSCHLALADGSPCCQTFWFSLLNLDFSAGNVWVCVFFLNIYLFILRERERDSRSGGGAVREGERERERERIPSRLHTIHTISAAPDAGLEPRNREIMTRAKVRCSADSATQAPRKCVDF